MDHHPTPFFSFRWHQHSNGLQVENNWTLNIHYDLLLALLGAEHVQKKNEGCYENNAKCR